MVSIKANLAIKTDDRRTVTLLVSDASRYAQVMLKCIAHFVIRTPFIDELDSAIPGMLNLRKEHLFFVNAPAKSKPVGIVLV